VHFRELELIYGTGAGNRLNVYSTTAAPPSAPVHVLTAGSYTRIGCYTEGNSTRALSEAHYINYTSQTVEKCAKFCEAGSYAVMGVEYGGECMFSTFSRHDVMSLTEFQVIAVARPRSRLLRQYLLLMQTVI
jgi:hypothetical protein